jgi:UDP-glucose 4-epimerase
LKITIIGASGYIGQNLTFKLSQAGYSITAIVRSIEDRLIINNNIKYKEVSDDRLFDKSILNDDIIIHAAHPRNPNISIGSIYSDFENIIRPSCEMIDALAENKTKLIFISSGGSIYGNTNKQKLTENDQALPISTYGLSKLMIENYIKFSSSVKKLRYLILRPSNIYGFCNGFTGNYVTNGFINLSIEKIQQNKKITIFGKNGMIRDYLHMDDFVSALIKLIHFNKESTTFNISTSQGHNNLDIINILSNITKKDIGLIHEKERSFDSKKSILCNSKLVDAINWMPGMNIKEGLKNTYTFINNHDK